MEDCNNKNIKYLVDLIEHGTLEELIEGFCGLEKIPDEVAFEVIQYFIKNKHGGTFQQQIISYLARTTLLCRGLKGLALLINLIQDQNIHLPYRGSIIKSVYELTNVTNSSNSSISRYGITLPKALITIPSDEMRIMAKSFFFDYVRTVRGNMKEFYTLLGILKSEAQNTLANNDIISVMLEDVFHILFEDVLKISTQQITAFKSIINEERPEQTYQEFFSRNLVFLHPLASRKIDQKKLGTELITDFVIETIDLKYLVVEIEKPQDRIFTKKGDFSAAFIHAYGQVLDFINWIETNISYAQKTMQGVISPSGLLIMGQKKDLSELNMQKLAIFNRNSKDIVVLTYDDILLQAESLYSNIKKKNKFFM